MFERRLSIARSPPAPPVPRTFARIRQLSGGNGSALRGLGINACHVATGLGPHVLLRALAVLVHAIAYEWIEGDRQEARLVSPIFEELALAVGQRVECLHSIRAEPRERRDVMGTDKHAH